MNFVAKYGLIFIVILIVLVVSVFSLYKLYLWKIKQKKTFDSSASNNKVPLKYPLLSENYDQSNENSQYQQYVNYNQGNREIPVNHYKIQQSLDTNEKNRPITNFTSSQDNYMQNVNNQFSQPTNEDMMVNITQTRDIHQQRDIVTKNESSHSYPQNQLQTQGERIYSLQPNYSSQRYKTPESESQVQGDDQNEDNIQFVVGDKFTDEFQFVSQSPIRNIVLVGFGAVQKALMTLIYEKERWMLERHQIVIIEPLDVDDSEILQKISEVISRPIVYMKNKVTERNIKQILRRCVVMNSLVIDLAYRINTSQIVRFCGKKGAFYINTAIDHWKFSLIPLFETKQDILQENPNYPKTAILNFGANPGLISIFVKYSLEQLAKSSNNKLFMQYVENGQYNYLARDLGLTMIQISERDNQQQMKENQENTRTSQKNFVNTWSVVGFLDEAFDKAQISFGTHEKELPVYTNRKQLETSGQVAMKQFGHELKTISYEPAGGKLIGMNIPHAECYSLVDFLKIDTQYRPSIHYSYLPSDNCKLITHYRDFCVDNQTLLPESNVVLRGDQIEQGFDSLGALMYFRDRNNNLKTLWTGTIVNKEDTKDLGNEINPTTQQVAIGTLSAILWMIKEGNRERGILEPEQLPAEEIINYCKPYLGTFLVNHDCTKDYKPISDQYKDLLVLPSNIQKDFVEAIHIK